MLSLCLLSVNCKHIFNCTVTINGPLQKVFNHRVDSYTLIRSRIQTYTNTHKTECHKRTPTHKRTPVKCFTVTILERRGKYGLIYPTLFGWTNDRFTDNLKSWF